MFPSEESVKAVFAFDALPMTPEKKEISRKYTSDEIGHIEFAGLARKYVDSHDNSATGGARWTRQP